MTKDKKIEIQFSKITSTVFFLFFLLIGILSLFFSLSRAGSGVFLVAVIFCGFLAALMFRNLTNTKPAIIISQEGITDNSSAFSVGLIPWTHIEEIKIVPAKHRYLKIIVKFGSSISINPNFLKINLDALHQLLIEKMEEYQS